MKLLEAQAKEILSGFGIPVPENAGMVSRPGDIPRVLKKAGAGPWVLKAQVLTGGRGKAGGIRVVRASSQMKKNLLEMLGMTLVTAQTGPEGVPVRQVLLEKPMEPARELYFSVALDRRLGCALLIASSEGGVEIETLARNSPEKILKMEIGPSGALEDNQARELLFRLGLYDSDQKKSRERAQFFKNCVRAFFALDASLLEINPLALTAKGGLVCLDAKVTVDDNALFRHPELARYEKAACLSPAEKEAKAAGISYIPLSGDIGCMVNGAGLAMATMDLLKQHGGDPANFLDVGGGANVEQVTRAFKIILSDKNVKAVFVNIFGGIMRCDVIAEGVVSAAKVVKLSVPLVVRLEGNRKEEGAAILSKSGLDITSVGDLSLAAARAVELSRNHGRTP
ncbi:MAG: succinate--CoA ligase subunit beta [Elusimicrobia bacterium RIFCSPHIGHO2_01_FULL_64_10]|nr:MAG: succinate--CoA ligase subunit beta [Elusimicrobia bacterium RIFCSPHIGHO2_01_FULL_64_10]